MKLVCDPTHSTVAIVVVNVAVMVVVIIVLVLTVVVYFSSCYYYYYYYYLLNYTSDTFNLNSNTVLCILHFRDFDLKSK